MVISEKIKIKQDEGVERIRGDTGKTFVVIFEVIFEHRDLRISLR